MAALFGMIFIFISICIGYPIVIMIDNKIHGRKETLKEIFKNYL